MIDYIINVFKTPYYQMTILDSFVLVIVIGIAIAIIVYVFVYSVVAWDWIINKFKKLFKKEEK